jgi:PAS domain S-box-containing protein
MTKKILVADDSATARELVSSLLREQGYQVIEAADGLEAVKQAYQTYPDLIVLDIFMPKINGYQVCRMLKNDELTKDIPVLVLTSASSKENRFWSLRTGADKFVVKTDDSLEGLAAVVGEMLTATVPRRFTKEHVAKVVPSDPVEIFEKLAGLLDKELYTATLDKMKFEIILQGIGEGLFSVDRTGVITEFNAAMVSLSGISRAKALGKNARDLFKETLCSGSCLFEEAFNSKADIIDRERYLALPGCGEKTPVMVSVSLIKEDQDKIEGAICVIRDISKTKAAERMKEDFVSMLTHELRSPISIVIEAIDVVLFMGQLSEAQKKYCQMAKDRASGLLGLVNNLLDISKMESDLPVLNVATIDIAALASKCILEMNVIANEKGITVLSEGMDKPVMVPADGARLEQVFINLLSNAVKFTPEQGTITVRVTDGPAAVECAVIDTGMGMKPEAVGRIFDKYHQIHDTAVRQKGGTGLGLSVVKSIITAHNGIVWAESEPGKGARMLFTLPKTRGSDACIRKL